MCQSQKTEAPRNPNKIGTIQLQKTSKKGVDCGHLELRKNLNETSQYKNHIARHQLRLTFEKIKETISKLLQKLKFAQNRRCQFCLMNSVA